VITPGTRVGITGANGFVGSNLCSHLLASGCDVHGLVRPGSDRRFVSTLRELRLHEGELGDRTSLERAFAGAALVFHVAARTADWGPWSEFEATNIAGVTNVMEAARACGVRRVVHFSSVSVYGFPGVADVTENHPWRQLPEDRYVTSKQRGEVAALGFHGRGIEVAALRPGGLYGPNDHVTSLRLFDALERRRMPYVDGGRHLMAPAYIDNLLQAAVLAATRAEAAGRVYNVTDDGHTTWRQYLEWTCAELGCAAPRQSLPSAVAWPLAAGVESTWEFLRLSREPPLTRYRARAVMADSHYSSARAKRELGYAPAVTTREGLRHTVAWYRDFVRNAS